MYGQVQASALFLNELIIFFLSLFLSISLSLSLSLSPVFIPKMDDQLPFYGFLAATKRLCPLGSINLARKTVEKWAF